MATIISDPILSAEALFDDIGPAYELAFDGLDTQRASIEWLKQQLSDKTPAKVLDIGCGTGRPVCFELANAGHQVLGIDVSNNMIEAAKRNVPNASFERVDVGQYDSPPNSFDAITVYFSLIADVTQDEIKMYMQKISNWLKPGGSFVLATLPVDMNNAEVRWMGRTCIASGLDQASLVNHIKSVGFEVVSESISTFLPSNVGICKAEDVWEETHLFVYAKKL